MEILWLSEIFKTFPLSCVNSTMDWGMAFFQCLIYAQQQLSLHNSSKTLSKEESVLEFPKPVDSIQNTTQQLRDTPPHPAPLCTLTATHLDESFQLCLWNIAVRLPASGFIGTLGSKDSN